MDYNAWAKAYDDIFPLKTETLNFLKQHLNGDIIGDIGCGSGNYSIALAKAGYQVTGIDITKPLIDLATKKSNGINNLKFEVQDMRKFEGTHQYDSLFSIGNSLVHLLDKDDIKLALNNFFKALKPNGTLVLQIINYDRILDQKIETLPTLKGNTYAMKRKYKINGALINFQTILKKNAQTFINDVYLYPLRQADLENLARAVGFNSFEYFGSFDGERFDLKESQALIAIIKK